MRTPHGVINKKNKLFYHFYLFDMENCSACIAGLQGEVAKSLMAIKRLFTLTGTSLGSIN